ncbi:MAG: SDR family NAD(P)-dependent oxidoreductase [Desulfobulbia bacterium]
MEEQPIGTRGNDTTSPTALITGATTGIGMAISRALARKGYNVAVTGQIPKLEALLQHKDLTSVKAVPIQLNLCDKQSVESAFRNTLEGLNHLDVLINNAGTTLHKPVVDVTWEDWDRVMNTNLRGAYFLSALFARHCLEQNRAGSIVNIASTHGLTGLSGRSVYGISKGGVIQMTRMMAIEWADSNIRVNAIAPTTVLTPSRMKFLSDENTRETMRMRIPNQRFVKEDEVAAAACFLVSPKTGSITGHTLALDGGLLSQ